MERLTDCLIPLILAAVCTSALAKRKDAYHLFLSGAADGLYLLKNILPALIGLLTAVELFVQSGAAELMQSILSPLLVPLGIPTECALLMLVRPLSGSAALAVGTELMRRYGTDSLVGRTAAIMLGSTETTFYTISVYLGAAGVKKSRYTLPAALFADFVGFFTASLCARVM